MNVFELAFIAGCLAAIAALVVSGVSVLRGKRSRAFAILQRLVVCAVSYMGVVVLVALVSPRKIYRIGDAQCFDDWCITVSGADRIQSTSVEVALRLSSRARRVPQGEKGTTVYLLDSRGRRYNALPEPDAVPFATPLAPGESVTTRRSFRVRPEARNLRLVYTREGGFPIEDFIIGENRWFHGPPIVPLGDRNTRQPDLAPVSDK